ncbi:MAG: biotin carboxylase [Acidimicrobiia bacterium]|nr:biotin carboxylase [Acidimicrobiia bacterium]
MSDITLTAPLQGTVLRVAAVGESIRPGRAIVVIESMKMEHDVVLDENVELHSLLVAVGESVKAGQPLAIVRGVSSKIDASDAQEVESRERVDLREVLERRSAGTDESRVEATDRRHAAGRRTARENVLDLVDPGSFVEYGPLVLAAQRRRRSVEDLIARTQSDGLVAGLATVGAEEFPGRASRVAVMSYDYAVLAGTQGQQNHRKKDRMFDVVERLRIPLVFFAEGGGGRPGDTDGLGVSGLDCWAFHDFARLSGLVPLVGITGGYCFAGNAAILGCCDVVIALRGSNIGMGGPAMIEGGGLGVHRAEDIGPVEVQTRNGVVDVLADDDAHAVRLAKQYLSYFQGTTVENSCPDQEALRTVVPENRTKAYDVRNVIVGLFDTGSVLELRAAFGPGMVTALARVEGRPVGVVANNPMHLGGAIDSDGADKAARFLQLCDAHGLPVVSLVDTPGMMVGPDVEETALVRHCSRLFVTAVNMDVPLVSVVLRKSYGLGAQAMMGGSTKAPLACVSWPTGEFGGMGLEGAVRLGYRRELEAISDDEERERVYRSMVERMYEHGKAVSVAGHFEIDDVIDPAETRTWLMAILESAPEPDRSGKRRPYIDTW